jgi:hypothetical protein
MSCSRKPSWCCRRLHLINTPTPQQHDCCLAYPHIHLVYSFLSPEKPLILGFASAAKHRRLSKDYINPSHLATTLLFSLHSTQSLKPSSQLPTSESAQPLFSLSLINIHPSSQPLIMALIQMMPSTSNHFKYATHPSPSLSLPLLTSSVA